MAGIHYSTIFLLSVLLGLTACNSVSTQITDQDKIVPIDTIVATSNESQATIDTVNYDETIFPFDSLLHTKILKTGIFHEDEVWQSADKEKWFGLFIGSNGFYLEETQIKTQRVNDPVLDENENEKTGWEVSTSKKDSNYLLIEALPFLQNRQVQYIALNKNQIYPGDTLNFFFLGKEYKLFATGGKKKVQSDPEAFDLWNYKLYLTTTKDGQQIKQLLVAQPSFDDKMIEILFAGDIDVDGTLDLIIDTSGHYNATSPTLYLSQPADKKEVTKPVGRHTSVGC